MDLNDDRHEVLSAVECLQLLTGGGLGHVAFSSRALPAIHPVMFVIDQGEIVFRVRAETELDVATRGTVLAFEADRIQPGVGGWSVFVTGVARHLAGDPTNASYRVVSLSPDLVSGRRIVCLPQIDSLSSGELATRPTTPVRRLAARS